MDDTVKLYIKIANLVVDIESMPRYTHTPYLQKLVKALHESLQEINDNLPKTD